MAKRKGFTINTDVYYVAINNINKECIITTSKTAIALFLGVSVSSVYNYIGDGTDYISTKYSIYCSPRVVKRPLNNKSL